VQLLVYVGDEHEQWVLSWGLLARERAELKRPAVGPPARVLLTDPKNPFGGATGLRTFRSDLFPTTVIAMDGLHSLALDHAPRWESAARRQALLDWLRRGGELHLLQDGNGKFPAFSASLAALNNPLDRFRLGAGRVVRHAVSRGTLSNEWLAEKGYPLPTLHAPDDAHVYDYEDTVLDSLGNMVRPDHSWGLIFLTTVAYIVLIGPVNYLFGRKRGRDYRLTLLFFLVTVALFTWLLGVIGRRGHDETAVVHSVSYARQIEPDLYDVTQWVNAFVTRGATYTIAHASRHNAYATCQEYEAVDGAILNGLKGQFQVDIPLYSSRPFLHRGRLKADAIKLRVVRWSGTDALEALVLEPAEGFPSDVLGLWACHGGTLYTVAMRDGVLETDMASAMPVANYMDGLQQDLHMARRRRYQQQERAASPRKLFHPFGRLLMARALGGCTRLRQCITYPTPAADRVQLLIFARSPEGLGIRSGSFGESIGYVLYHVDVFKPESPHG